MTQPDDPGQRGSDRYILLTPTCSSNHFLSNNLIVLPRQFISGSWCDHAECTCLGGRLMSDAKSVSISKQLQHDYPRHRTFHLTVRHLCTPEKLVKCHESGCGARASVNKKEYLNSHHLPNRHGVSFQHDVRRTQGCPRLGLNRYPIKMLIQSTNHYSKRRPLPRIMHTEQSIAHH
jgi:hypothetical protein